MPAPNAAGPQRRQQTPIGHSWPISSPYAFAAPRGSQFMGHWREACWRRDIAASVTAPSSERVRRESAEQKEKQRAKRGPPNRPGKAYPGFCAVGHHRDVPPLIQPRFWAGIPLLCEPTLSTGPASDPLGSWHALGPPQASCRAPFPCNASAPTHSYHALPLGLWFARWLPPPPPLPPFAVPPPPRGGGDGHLAQKASKIPGAKENFYKAPKLIYTEILWYSFVVQSPPPPVGGDRHDIGGEITRGGGGVFAPAPPRSVALQSSQSRSVTLTLTRSIVLTFPEHRRGGIFATPETVALALALAAWLAHHFPAACTDLLLSTIRQTRWS